MEPDLTGWWAALRVRLDFALGELFPSTWPDAFGEALRYPLHTGGKRIRPAIHVAAWQALTGRPVDEAPLEAALAVELIHTYSLVHDDLPAMDDDDERRGRPTVHVAFDEATAILVGDALLTEAFSVLARARLPAEVRVQLVSGLAAAAGHRGMVGGQVGDVSMGASIRDVQTLQAVHERKTGALIRWSAVSAGQIAGADREALRALDQYGRAVGLAFQLADDLLDADEAADPHGPPSYVRLLGAAETARRARALADEAEAAVAGLPHPGRLVALARFTVSRTL
jgi:geranylgeranyl pyrophosphate synthase